MAPDARLLAGFDAYLDRLWTEASDRRGLFVGAGVGSYDGNPTIDQAGATQMLVFRQWPVDRWVDIC